MGYLWSPPRRATATCLWRAQELTTFVCRVLGTAVAAAVCLMASPALGIPAAHATSGAQAGPRITADPVVSTPSGGVVGPQLPIRIYDHEVVPAGGLVSACGPVDSEPNGAPIRIVNVTVVRPSVSGYLGLMDEDTHRVVASALNFAKGHTTSNLVLAHRAPGRCVTLVNRSSAAIHVTVDQQGYTSYGELTAPGTVGSLPVARRLLDTRTRKVAVPAGGSVEVPVTSIAPSVGAAVLNLTVTQPTRAGWLLAYPSGSSRPPVGSSLNFLAGETRAGLAVSRAGANGRVTIHNGSSGTAHVIVDAEGWVRQGDATGTLAGMVTDQPRRVLDTRTAGARIAARGSIVIGREQLGIPAGSTGAVMTLTTTGSTGSGALMVSARSFGAVTFEPGRATANLVLARTDAAGNVAIYNDSPGATHVVIDVVGYVNVARHIRGRVLDSTTGQGVGGQSVSVGPVGFVDAVARTTAADGGFEGDLLDTYWRLSSNSNQSQGARVCAQPSATDSERWTTACVDAAERLPLGASLTDVEVRVSPAGRLEVSGQDTTGAAVDGFVRIHRPGSTTLMSNTFERSLIVPVGDYQVSYQPVSQKLATEWLDDVPHGSPIALLQAPTVHVRQGERVAAVVTVDPKSTLRGTVTDAAGAPVTATVWLKQPNGFVNTTTYAGEGRFSTSLHGGTFIVCANRAADLTTATCLPDPVTVDSGQTLDIGALSVKDNP